MTFANHDGRFKTISYLVFFHFRVKACLISTTEVEKTFSRGLFPPHSGNRDNVRAQAKENIARADRLGSQLARADRTRVIV